MLEIRVSKWVLGAAMGLLVACSPGTKEVRSAPAPAPAAKQSPQKPECTVAADCHGMLPHLCRVCPGDAGTVCAHFACVQDACVTQVCPGE